MRRVLDSPCTYPFVTAQGHLWHLYQPTSLSAKPHLLSLLPNHLPSSGHPFLDRHTSVHAGEQSFKLAVLIDKVNTLFPVNVTVLRLASLLIGGIDFALNTTEARMGNHKT